MKGARKRFRINPEVFEIIRKREEKRRTMNEKIKEEVLKRISDIDNSSGIEVFMPKEMVVKRLKEIRAITKIIDLTIQKTAQEIFKDIESGFEKVSIKKEHSGGVQYLFRYSRWKKLLEKIKGKYTQKGGYGSKK